MIFLAGGGSELDSFDLDEEFVKGVKNILYLPIAMDTGKHPACLEWFTNAMSKHGVTEITMWHSVEGKNYHDVASFDAIYIGGGNTYKLLGELYASDFLNVLKRFAAPKKLYGGSAGAIILGKDISTARGFDEEMAIPSDKGLDLLNGYSVSCHYHSEQDKLLQKLSESKKILALTEKSGLYVNNKIFGEAIIFINGKKSLLRSPKLP